MRERWMMEYQKQHPFDKGDWGKLRKFWGVGIEEDGKAGVDNVDGDDGIGRLENV